MKKCLKCNVVFHLDDRNRCLYCDALLITVTRDDAFNEVGGGLAIQKMSADKAHLSDRMQYLVACYFKTRTFPFIYLYSRNELKQGKTFKRFLVQPFHATFFLKIPWLVINFVDSIFFHLNFRGYCPECQWKYAGVWEDAKQSHPPEQCAYNKEYTSIINEILSGQIAKSEETFRRLALEKIKSGKRSAYYDLCSRKRQAETVFDIMSVWISVCLLIYGLVLLARPLIKFLVKWTPENLM